MRLGLNILETSNDISKLILEQIQIKLESAINQSLNSITSELKIAVADALRNQPEYSSLMAGTLKAEFGIPNSSVVESVITNLVDTLTITKQPIKLGTSGLSGGLTLTMMKSDDMNGIINAEIGRAHV